MRKIVYVIITMVVISVVILFFGLQYRTVQLKKVERYSWHVTDTIMAQLDDVSLIRQLFMFYLNLDDESLLNDLMPGSIFIHTKNIPAFADGRENLTLLDSSIEKINSIYRQKNLPVPLYSIDQEGGRVRRIRSQTTDFPSNMTLGEAYIQTRRRDLPLLAGFYTCMELRIHGIQWAFSPVVDVQINPDNPVIGVRSFGSDPQLVADLASEYVKGIQNARCLSTIKHFPGHGDTSLDSHTDLPVLNKSREELERVELYPYEKMLKSKNAPQSLMSAHIVFDKISPQPATLSSTWLTDDLRKKRQFEGIIITDDLAMNAMNIYQKQNNIKNLAVDAFLAGADVLLYSYKPAETRAMINGFIDAYHKKDISRERIVESVRRIIYRKINLGVMDLYIRENKHKWSPELQKEADILLRRSGEIEQNIETIKSQLAKADSVNQFISKNGIKTILGNPMAHSNVQQYALFTDMQPGDPNYGNLLKKSSKIYDIRAFNENNCGNKCVILHTAKTPLESILKLKKNKPWIIYSMTDPFPAKKFHGLICEKDLLITTFSDTNTSRENLIKTWLENKIPPKASVIF